MGFSRKNCWLFVIMLFQDGVLGGILVLRKLRIDFVMMVEVKI